ncbi:MAG TPA: hypothetical protein VGF28_09350 [Thermoanaerobaculia bacterium]
MGVFDLEVVAVSGLQVKSPRGTLDHVIALTIVVAVTIAAWHELHVVMRTLCVVAILLVLYDLNRARWHRLVLQDDAVVVYDRIRRIRRIPYRDIWRVTWAEGSSFDFDTESHGVVRFEAKAAGLEALTRELIQRAGRSRESVEVCGDLMIEWEQNGRL